MIVIKNNSKKVVVFKSPSAAPLRLFPGPNNVPVDDIKELKSYFEGNKAAIARFDATCEDITGKPYDKKAAERSMAKNKELNKAYKLVADTKAKLGDKMAENSDLLAQLKEMKARIDELEADANKRNKKDKKEDGGK